MKNILILTLIVMTSVSVHQQYAMEQEKTLSHNIESLRDRALSVYLKYADFNNISIQELPNLKFLDQLPQSPKIAEYLTKKYLKHHAFSIKNITLSEIIDIESLSYHGQTLLALKGPYVAHFILNLQNNRFYAHGVMNFKYVHAGSATQFDQENYIIYDNNFLIETKQRKSHLQINPLKEIIIVGVTKNHNENQIFMAPKDGNSLFIQKTNEFFLDEKNEIDGIGFRKSINPDTIVVSKDSNAVIVEDVQTQEKFMWDREKGTYTSLANFIKNSDSILDVYGNSNILIKSFNANNNTFTLNLWRKTKNKHYVIFSRNYPCDIADLKARLIEQNNQIIGIVTCITKNQASNITVSLFNTEPFKLNPTEILFLAQLLKNPIIIAAQE